MATKTPFKKNFTNMRKKRDWFGSVTAGTKAPGEAERPDEAATAITRMLEYMQSPAAHMNPYPGFHGVGQQGMQQAAIQSRNILNAIQLAGLREELNAGTTQRDPDDYEFGSFGQSHPY